MSLADVRAADVSYPDKFGSRFSPQRVPTLGELLAFLKGRARVMVEIKKESSQAGQRCLRAPDRRGDREVGGAGQSGPWKRRWPCSRSRPRSSSAWPRFLPDAPRGHLFYRDPEDVIFAAAAKVNAHLRHAREGTSLRLPAGAGEAELLGVASLGVRRPGRVRRARASSVFSESAPTAPRACRPDHAARVRA